jgi:hypothetical protein
MNYIHDIPKSQGVINACKRARQMVELKWTPLSEVPCCYNVKTTEGNKQIDGYFRAWRPRKGIIYTGVRRHEKYVGFNISLETFVTAVANPNSVLYANNLHGYGKFASAYYGNVCSAFVSYALDLPYMHTCAMFPKSRDFMEVDTCDLNGLQLCDILLNPRHVVMVTDILRDAYGNICKITVSESTPPSCIATTFTLEEVQNFYLERRHYKAYRYKGIDNVRYTPSPYVPIEGDPIVEVEDSYTLMTNFGNKANYVRGVDTVELSVLEDGWETVSVTLPNGTVECHTTKDGKVTILPEIPGFYRACCVKDDRKSRFVQWCVVDVDIITNKSVYKAGEPISASFCNRESQDKAVLYMIKSQDDFSKLRGEISAEEVSNGEITIQQNDYLRQGGEFDILIVFQNEYGQYASRRAHFTVENGV